MSEPAKRAGSKIGSSASKMNERRRLEIQAELMDQKLQMEIEKRERELELENTRRETEREKFGRTEEKTGYGKKTSRNAEEASRVAS